MNAQTDFTLTLIYPVRLALVSSALLFYTLLLS